MMFKPLIYSFLLLVMSMAIISCNDQSTWDEYADWREANSNFYVECQNKVDTNGNMYYQSMTPEWNPNAQILMHFKNDRKLTQGNLSPLFTSTCNVIYEGRLYNGEVFDNSYHRQDSIYTFTSADVIQGWAIAISYMRVGDEAEVVIPYGLAYGHQEMNNSIIKPYSVLVFDIKLVDIPHYEVKD